MKSVFNKKGSTLVWVLLVFLFLITICTVLLSAASMSFMSAVSQQTGNQAYFTARAAANATIKYIKDNPAAVANMVSASSGGGSAANMGSYKVYVNYVDSSNNIVTGPTTKIKIKSVATKGGQTNILYAYMNQSASVPSFFIPSNDIFYSTGVTNSIGQCNVTGDIFINGGFNLSNGSLIVGNVYCVGDVSITGAGNATNNIITSGKVTLGNSGLVKGYVKCNDDFTMSGSAEVKLDVFTNGDFTTGTKGSAVVDGNAVCVGNARFGGNNKVTGNITAGGSFSPSNLSAYVGGATLSNQSVTPMDFSNFTNITAPPNISVPTSAQEPQLYQDVTMTNYTISSSGTIARNGTLILNTGTLPDEQDVTIDATTSDIDLLISNTAYSVSNHVDFLVKGGHNVTIYMTGSSSSFTLGNNSFVGMNSSYPTLNLYIIGDSTVTKGVTLTNCELDAFIYIPNGTFKATGGELNSHMFQGFVTASSITVANNIHLIYVAPTNLANSPLAPLGSISGGSSGSGGSGSGSGGWSLGGWSKS